MADFVKTSATLAVACAVALGVFSAANAQVRDENETGLLLDTRGAPVMNATGLCWHTAYGPPPMWTRGCHAEGPAPVAQDVTPVAQRLQTNAVSYERQRTEPPSERGETGTVEGANAFP
jgi:hypothetical protein